MLEVWGSYLSVEIPYFVLKIYSNSMATPSFNILPFTKYQWLPLENSLEIIVIIGLILVVIGYVIYGYWKSIEQKSN